MKNIIIPLTFLLFFIFTYCIVNFILNVRLSGKFNYIVDCRRYLDEEDIYNNYPKFKGYDKVYEKYEVTQKFTLGILKPKIKTDTIWSKTVYAENYGE